LVDGASIPEGLSPEEELLLGDWCSAHEVAVDESTLERLGLYRKLLLDWGTRTNLTSIKVPREILIKHFLDSLAVLPWVPKGEPLLDIGTGAGFPGLVLKLARLSQPVTLAEATGKKVGFLEHVRRVFALEGCEILHGRLAGGEAGLVGRFGMVISRGVQPPSDFIRLAVSYLKPEGVLLAMTGREKPSEELEEDSLRSSTGCRLDKVELFELPERAGTRHLLFFVKEAESVPRGT